MLGDLIHPFSSLVLTSCILSGAQGWTGRPRTYRDGGRSLARTTSLPRSPRPSCTWCGRPCRTSPSSSWRWRPSSHCPCPSTTPPTPGERVRAHSTLSPHPNATGLASSISTALTTAPVSRSCRPCSTTPPPSPSVL